MEQKVKELNQKLRDLENEVLQYRDEVEKLDPSEIDLDEVMSCSLDYLGRGICILGSYYSHARDHKSQ